MAALQLVERGYFPSAPLEPTLAVDMKVLDFVATLFLNVAPNTTAWCKTVETFLSKQGYKLTTEVSANVNICLPAASKYFLQGSLRKRFGNALLWYTSLQDATTRHVDAVISCARRTLLELDDGLDMSDENDSPVHSPCNSTFVNHSVENHIPHLAPIAPAGPAASMPGTPSHCTRRHPTCCPTVSGPCVEGVEDKDLQNMPVRQSQHSVGSSAVLAPALDSTQTLGSNPSRESSQRLTRPVTPPLQLLNTAGRIHHSMSKKRPHDDGRDSGLEYSANLPNPFADPLPRRRPSDYLRSRCPLCFGGKHFQSHRASSKECVISIKHLLPTNCLVF
jgi:hypothetical protein